MEKYKAKNRFCRSADGRTAAANPARHESSVPRSETGFTSGLIELTQLPGESLHRAALGLADLES
jgi:hypothetical protein